MFLPRLSRPIVLTRQWTESLVVARQVSSTMVNSEPVVSDDIKPFSYVPGPSGLRDLPYIGTLFLFKPFSKYSPHDINDMANDYAHEYGDIFKMRFGKDHMVYVNHPDYAKTVLQANYDLHNRICLDLSLVCSDRLNKPKGMLMLKGNEWVQRRKPAQEKLLRPAVAASYVPLIEKVTNDLVKKLNSNPVIDDLLWTMTNYAIESVGMLCFNRRLGCLESGRESSNEVADFLREAFDLVQRSMFMPFKTFVYFRTPFYKRYESEISKFYDFVGKEISEQRQKLEQLENEGILEEYLEKEPNFMYSLLADGRLSDDEVNAIISDLIGAGIDSTANTLVFLLAKLALNPEKQAALYEEIQRIVGDEEVLTKEHIAQMSYLKACLKESHRMTFPVSFGAIRLPETDLVVGGYTIPRDTHIAINNRSMCMDERFFSKPKEFLPERWLRSTTGELAKSKDFPFAHKPFGYGPRSCLGQRFAETEIFIGISKIIQKFEVSMPSTVTDLKTTLRIFTTPADTVQMTFTERDH